MLYSLDKIQETSIDFEIYTESTNWISYATYEILQGCFKGWAFYSLLGGRGGAMYVYSFLGKNHHNFKLVLLRVRVFY